VSFIYGNTKFQILSKQLDLTAGSLYALPVTAGYSPDATAATPKISDIPAAARSIALANMVALPARANAQAGANATFDAGDITFPAVGAGDPIVAVVISNGTGTTNALLMYIDDLANLPLTPDGRDIQVTWLNPMVTF
jgi:hypothetical protein